MKLTSGLLGLGALLMASQVNAATVFAPTDGDVNFLFSTLDPSTQLAMFDDSDTSFAGSSLAISVPELIDFTSGGLSLGDFTATNEASATLNLTGSDWFILAISTDGGTSWSGDTSVNFMGANSYTVNFSDGSVLEVDVRVVPVPAAVWLFGSGLIGLIGVARRKKA